MVSTIESREDPLFPSHEVNTTLPSIYKCGIMLIFKGVLFLHDPWYSCTILEYLTCSFALSSRAVLLLHGVVFDLHLLTPYITSFFVSSARLGRIVRKNSRIAPVVQSRHWTWRGYYYCWPYDHLFVACHVKNGFPFFYRRSQRVLCKLRCGRKLYSTVVRCTEI